MRCLHHLNALVSPHPYDLEAVTPIVKYDMAQFKLVEEVGALGGLDSRPDLLAMNPYEFERLIPRSRTLIMHDTGHLAMLERAATFNQALLEFLDAPAAEAAPPGEQVVEA